jgi:hypothetical protein
MHKQTRMCSKNYSTKSNLDIKNEEPVCMYQVLKVFRNYLDIVW